MNHKKTKKNRNGLDAYLTVEAAAVMSIVLLSVMSLILFDFHLHDRIAAENALACTLEMYSHRNPYGPWADDYRMIAADTGIYITGEGKPVELTAGLLKGSISGTVWYEEECLTGKNYHIRAERLLRAATLAELKKKLGNREDAENTDDTSQKEQESTK